VLKSNLLASLAYCSGLVVAAPVSLVIFQTTPVLAYGHGIAWTVAKGYNPELVRLLTGTFDLTSVLPMLTT
jgi:hypothetical protein